MERDRFGHGILLGVVISVAGMLALGPRGGREALADGLNKVAVPPENGLYALLSQMNGQDTIVVVDPKAYRLAVYSHKGGDLNLSAVRNISYDLKYEEMGSQKPPVGDVIKDLEKRKQRP